MRSSVQRVSASELPVAVPSTSRLPSVLTPGLTQISATTGNRQHVSDSLPLERISPRGRPLASLFDGGIAMTNRYLPFCAGAILLAGCVAQPSPRLTTADNNFIMQAASGGMAEVALGRMAQQQAGSPAVRQLGAQMVTDHAPSNQELMALAARKGVTPAAAPDAARTAVARQLAPLSGPAFDQQYLASQRQDHEVELSLFTEQAQNGTDPDLRAYAAKYLPTLQHHTQELQNMTGMGGAS